MTPVAFAIATATAAVVVLQEHGTSRAFKRLAWLTMFYVGWIIWGMIMAAP